MENTLGKTEVEPIHAATLDVLTAEEIHRFLTPVHDEMHIVVLPMAVSTNALVRKQADLGAPEGLAILANEQSAGRGRRGRSFFSPPGTGVYMSLLLRPKEDFAKQAVRITTIAAVAMCQAIEEVSDERAQIKWINDIFVRGKKVCGILTEAVFYPGTDRLDYVVLGLGVNVCQPPDGFPPELAQIAGAVFPFPNNAAKSRLAAAFFNRFWPYYERLDHHDYVEQYRARSFAIGRLVQVISATQNRRALVLGLDEDCRLIVRYDDGTEDCLSSGEISIRL